MEDEYQVLSYLQNNEITSQRRISSRTGLSLGAVNLLLKKMIQKGLVKVEKLNSRSMRYILTPKGMQEKARLTYLFIRSSYQRIAGITRAIDDLLCEHGYESDNTLIILYGPTDEIFDIISGYLDRLKVHYRHYTENVEQGVDASDGQSLIITWREKEEARVDKTMRALNIMKIL